MLHEKSCGAIVTRIHEGERQFLVIKHSRGGHWSFPKGHVEAGETETQTAVREILEETGIHATIDTNFRKMLTYSPKTGIIKDVVIFYATADDAEPVPDANEIDKAVWLNEAKAFKKVNFKNYRDILRDCIKYLNKN